jgi:hypothetical protein
MSECIAIDYIIQPFQNNGNTIKEYLIFSDISHTLERFCALKEFKNIFRKCLSLIYSNCNDELDDILDIKPCRMKDIIDINK